MAQGRIKWFSETKGFGFIEDNDNGQAVYLHYTSIRDGKESDIKDGIKVSYDILETERGPEAANVRLAEC